MAYLTGDKFRNSYIKIQLAEAEKKREAYQKWLDSKNPPQKKEEPEVK